MLTGCAALLIGLVFLLISANKFVDSTAELASQFQLSPFLISLIVIGFGTSSPEMVVSAMAAAEGNPSISLGNAYGSNIANLGLVLGFTLLSAPLIVSFAQVRTQFLCLLFSTFVALFHAFTGHITKIDAGILLLLFGGFLNYSVKQDIASRQTDTSSPSPAPPTASLMKTIIWTLIGLIGLLLSSHLLIQGAVSLARLWGVSDLLMGLTIIAIGTSVPELAAAVTAARKGKHDMAIGNIVGSNLFNTLGVVGLAGLLAPIKIDPLILWRDLPIMGALTLFVLFACYQPKLPLREGREKSFSILGRPQGAILLICYSVYIAFVARGG